MLSAQLAPLQTKVQARGKHCQLPLDAQPQPFNRVISPCLLICFQYVSSYIKSGANPKTSALKCSDDIL